MVPFKVRFFMRVSYYFGDLKGDRNLENVPYGTLVETLMDPLKEA